MPRSRMSFELSPDDVVVTIHCGSRGLGHQIGTEFLKEMLLAAKASGIELIDRELACALSTQTSVSAISALCARQLIARWPTAKSWAITRVAFLPTFFPLAICSFCLMSRTTPARSKRTSSTEGIANSSSTAREPLGLLGHVTRACPMHYAPSVSRCSSAAVWGPGPTFWSGTRRQKTRHFPRRVTAPDGRCLDMPRSSSGVGARSSMNLQSAVSSLEFLQCAASPRRRRAHTRM